MFRSAFQSAFQPGFRPAWNQGSGGSRFTGLLDLYPGAAAAYSLERLAASTTNVVRVRRSSDDTEQDFTAAEVSDGTLTTFTGAGDGFVVTWYDQSGNGRNATQSTAASQPKIVDGGALVTEGISFDGIDDFLSLPLNIAAPYSHFILLNTRSSGRIMQGGSSFWGTKGNRTIEISYGVGHVTTETFADGEYLFNLNISDSINDSFFSNGNSVFQGSLGNATEKNTNLPSTVIPLSVDVKAHILWSSDQSANRAAIEANIAEIYGITLA